VFSLSVESTRYSDIPNPGSECSRLQSRVLDNSIFRIQGASVLAFCREYSVIIPLPQSSAPVPPTEHSNGHYKARAPCLHTRANQGASRKPAFRAKAPRPIPRSTRGLYSGHSNVLVRHTARRDQSPAPSTLRHRDARTARSYSLLLRAPFVHTHSHTARLYIHTPSRTHCKYTICISSNKSPILF